MTKISRSKLKSGPGAQSLNMAVFWQSIRSFRSMMAMRCVMAGKLDDAKRFQEEARQAHINVVYYFEKGITRRSPNSHT